MFPPDGAAFIKILKRCSSDERLQKWKEQLTYTEKEIIHTGVKEAERTCAE